MDPVKKVAEPFAVIRAFPEENPQADSLLEDVVMRYTENKIYDRYHLSFLEYMKLPCTAARELDKIANDTLYRLEKEENTRKANAANEAMSKITGK